MIRFAATGCLIVLGLSVALAQEPDRVAQRVTFAVHRTNVFSTHETATENNVVARMKVTISLDQFDKSPEIRPLRIRRVQLDAKMMPPEKLAEAFKSRSFLVTLTD